MSTNYSIIIGIEKYIDRTIDKVDYAENDATELSNILKIHGYDEKNQIVLLSNNATKTVIESKFNLLLKTLKKNDSFIFFYAGHGFCENSHNFITCYDTLRGDLVSTSISLQTIFNKFKNSCDRIIFFLDSCHSGLQNDEKFRGMYTDLNEAEFQDFIQQGKNYFVGFAACKSDEFSYPYTKFKHGIWTYNLIQALNGNAKEALERKKFLTGVSLQNYFEKAIPISLRDAYVKKIIQTPWCFGGYSSDFLIADLTKILEKKKAEIPYLKEKSYEFSKETTGNIKSLSVYKKKFHKEPIYNNSSTNRFVAEISTNDVKLLVDELYENLKNGLNLKRREIQINHNQNKASIFTKDFEINITIEQSDSSPNTYIKNITLFNITNNDLLFDETFNNLLSDYFNKLIVIPSKKILIVDIIDSLEEIENDEIKIYYPADNSFINIKIRGIDGEINIFPEQFELYFNRPQPPKKFIESFICHNKYFIDNDCNFKILESK